MFHFVGLLELAEAFSGSTVDSKSLGLLELAEACSESIAFSESIVTAVTTMMLLSIQRSLVEDDADRKIVVDLFKEIV